MRDMTAFRTCGDSSHRGIPIGSSFVFCSVRQMQQQQQHQQQQQQHQLMTAGGRGNGAAKKTAKVCKPCRMLVVDFIDFDGKFRGFRISCSSVRRCLGYPCWRQREHALVCLPYSCPRGLSPGFLETRSCSRLWRAMMRFLPYGRPESSLLHF